MTRTATQHDSSTLRTRKKWALLRASSQNTLFTCTLLFSRAHFSPHVHTSLVTCTLRSSHAHFSGHMHTALFPCMYASLSFFHFQFLFHSRPVPYKLYYPDALAFVVSSTCWRALSLKRKFWLGSRVCVCVCVCLCACVVAGVCVCARVYLCIFRTKAA